MAVSIHVIVQMYKLKKKKKRYVWNLKRINKALRIIIVLFLLDPGIEKINETASIFTVLSSVGRYSNETI